MFDFVAGDNPSQLFELCPLFQLTHVTFDPALPYVLLHPCVKVEENRRGSVIGSKFSKGPSWGPRAPRGIPVTSFCLEN